MAKNSLIFHAKTVALTSLLRSGLINKSLPSYRECEIQIDKLARMASDFDQAFSLQTTASIPMAKLGKKQGPYFHRLSRQSKHVDSIMNKLVREYSVQTVTLQLGAAHRNQATALAKQRSQKYVQRLNQRIYKVTEKALLQLGPAYVTKLLKK